MNWVGRINQALDEDRFCLYAQAIVPLDGGAEKHYELLIRMIDEQGEIILPGAFLPAAERYNLIEKLDAWVVSHACKLLAEHPLFFAQVDFVSINLSGPSLTNQAFLESILDVFSEREISPSKVCFEVTETIAISNLDAAIRFIKTLKKSGFRFALDDFGSGISSFGYLKNLPVDYLKIDGMFVKGIVEDPIDFAMVKSINEIGQVMGMQTIAEFVENNQIKELLMVIGVNYGQGYGLGKPKPLKELVLGAMSAVG
jgi:EAL domain-containing protein (putative c-di-GMP-specific phosphodiesterase class I)